jgi:hypothetical protein
MSNNGLYPFSATSILPERLRNGVGHLSSSDTGTIKRHLLLLARHFILSVSALVPKGKALVSKLNAVEPGNNIPADFWRNLRGFIIQLQEASLNTNLVSSIFKFLPEDTLDQHCINYSWCALELVSQQLHSHYVGLHRHWARTQIPWTYLEVLTKYLANEASLLGSWCAKLRRDLDEFCPTDDTPEAIALEMEQQEACFHQLRIDRNSSYPRPF